MDKFAKQAMERLIAPYGACPDTSEVLEAPESLELTYFPIPDANYLRHLMKLEQMGVEAVQAKAQGLMASETVLVDVAGKPLPGVSQRLAESLNKWLGELLQYPAISESFELEGEVGNVCATSWSVAYMVYQEFGRILVANHLKDLVDSMDAVVTLGLHAIANDKRPLAAYKKSFKMQPKEGVVVASVEVDALRHRLLFDAEQHLCQYLHRKGLIKVSEDRELSLTGLGKRLLIHMLAVMSLAYSIQKQGPTLAEQLVGAAKEETKSQREIEGDILNG